MVDICKQDSERLACVELELAHLKDGFEEVRDALVQLARDMHLLAVSDAERKEDRRTFERIFSEQREGRDELAKLWRRTDDIIAAREAAAKERLENEIRRQAAEHNKKNQWMFDIIKLFFAASLALLANHYGA